MLGPLILPLSIVEDTWSAWCAPQAAALWKLYALPEASPFADAAHSILQHLLNGQTKRRLHEMQLCRQLPPP